MRICYFRLALSLGLGFTNTAYAQFSATFMPSVIGNTIGMMAAQDAETACMTGATLPDSEIAEARGPSTKALLQYFKSAGSRQDISGSFHLDKKTKLTNNSVPYGAANLSQSIDPISENGFNLESSSLRFFRSFSEASALGQWMVKSDSGAIVGVYTAYFVRKSGQWKIRELTITSKDQKIVPAMQFCHVPGDVTPFRLSYTEQGRVRAEKRLSKARARYASENARLEAAKAKGDNSYVAINAASVEASAKAVEKAESALSDAQKAEADARENVQTVERLTVDVSNANLLALKQ